MNKFLRLFFVFISLTLLSVNVADAKKYGGGGYGGGSKSFSFTKSSPAKSSFFSSEKKTGYGSGGYDKSSTPTPPVNRQTYGASYGFQNKDAIKPDSFQKAKLDTERKKASKMALEDFRAKQLSVRESAVAKTAPPVKIPTMASTRYRERLSLPDRNYASLPTRRANFYVVHHYNPPAYLNNTGGSWGGLNGFFLGYMVNDILTPNSNGAQYMYHNQSDPAVMAYMAELRRQSADNIELRDKLSELDKQLAVMKAQGVQQQPGYVPEGVDPDVMYSKEYVDSHKADFYPKGQDIAPSEDEAEDEGGHGGLIFTTILLVMGFGVWFVFFRRT